MPNAMVDPRVGPRDALPRFNFLFRAVFSKKFCQIIVWPIPSGVGAPSPVRQILGPTLEYSFKRSKIIDPDS